MAQRFYKYVKFVRLTSLLVVGGLCLTAQTQLCPETLDASKRQNIVDYVSKKCSLPASVTLSLVKEKRVPDTCYQELTFEGKSELRTWSLTLYASPDLRFLTGELFDTRRDPIEDGRAQTVAVMRGLTQGADATRGPEDAAVTIVEFSDFQCPFCRRFAQTLDEALTGNDENDVRVVFRHLPLSMHAWARVAAQGAGCAQLQSGAAFWSMHDRLFQNQEKLTADNIRERIAEFAKNTKGLDGSAFQKCMDNGMSLGLVLKDVNLATANQVDGTPTLFINGKRAQGPENAAKLREMIAEARKEARNQVAPLGGAGDLEHRRANASVTAP